MNEEGKHSEAWRGKARRQYKENKIKAKRVTGKPSVSSASLSLVSDYSNIGSHFSFLPHATKQNKQVSHALPKTAAAPPWSRRWCGSATFGGLVSFPHWIIRKRCWGTCRSFSVQLLTRPSCARPVRVQLGSCYINQS